MKSLKSALSMQQNRSKISVKDEPNASLLRGVNKSKSGALWAFNVQEEKVTEASLDTDSILRLLNDKLENAFAKDYHNQSKVVFERIIEEFQDGLGTRKTQLASLMLMEDKLTDIIELSHQNIRPFLEDFNQYLTAKIAKIRNKQKSTQLSKFDNLISSNFKKRPQEQPYFQAEELKKSKISGQKNRKESKSSRKASNSTDNKLNRLLSKEKRALKQKDSSHKIQQETGNATTNQNYEQSISFSAALASNITVKTRKRKSSNEKKPKAKKIEDSQKDGDEAFIFFRPKKNRK